MSRSRTLFTTATLRTTRNGQRPDLPAPPTLGEQTRRRVVVHLIPYLFFLYILAYIDRTNVSVAKLGMQKDPSQGGLGFSEEVIGFGAGIFFWGYWILEIPSTLSVLKWGARWVFVRILILWGACCALIGTIGTPWADYRLRVAAELPPRPSRQPVLLPPVHARVLRGRLLPVGDPLPVPVVPAPRPGPGDRRFHGRHPGVLAARPPISGLMLQMDAFGVEGWRWIFILQGLAPILAGFATLFFLPDRPEKAAWLTARGAGLAPGRVRGGEGPPGHGHRRPGGQPGRVVLLLTAYYFCRT